MVGKILADDLKEDIGSYLFPFLRPTLKTMMVGRWLINDLEIFDGEKFSFVLCVVQT